MLSPYRKYLYDCLSNNPKAAVTKQVFGKNIELGPDGSASLPREISKDDKTTDDQDPLHPNKRTVMLWKGLRPRIW